MAESIDWLDDGTPYSPRFGDRYHSEHGGMAQSREVFLHGCGLPQAWAGAAQWRILETGFGFGLNFLTTWAAWRADPRQPTLLHFVSLEAWPVSAADLLRAAQRHPELLPLAQELHAQYWGLLPGCTACGSTADACCSRCALATHRPCCASSTGRWTRSTSTASARRPTPTSGAPTPSRPWRAAAAAVPAWPPGPLPSGRARCAHPVRFRGGKGARRAPKTRQPARHLQPRLGTTHQPHGQARTRAPRPGALPGHRSRAGRRGHGGQPGPARLAGAGARRRNSTRRGRLGPATGAVCPTPLARRQCVLARLAQRRTRHAAAITGPAAARPGLEPRRRAGAPPTRQPGPACRLGTQPRSRLEPGRQPANTASGRPARRQHGLLARPGRLGATRAPGAQAAGPAGHCLAR
jgi:hypothetical protein